LFPHYATLRITLEKVARQAHCLARAC
jgi:hypothetical protein